ncbi:MAG: hypothetical protein AAFO94_06055, partial [Bacteroidota bacterium]
LSADLFIGELDTEIGYELYSIQVEAPSSLKHLANAHPYKVVQTSNQAMVQGTGQVETVLVEIYDVTGRQLRTIETQTDTWFQLESQRGAQMLVFQIGEWKFADRVIRVE